MEEEENGGKEWGEEEVTDIEEALAYKVKNTHYLTLDRKSLLIPT